MVRWKNSGCGTIILWSFPAADILTFIIAVLFIRQTYRELSIPDINTLREEQ